MLREIHRIFVSGLLAIALLLPAFSQIVYQDKASQFFCAPTGSLSPDAEKAVKQISALLNLDVEDAPSQTDHCEECLLTFAIDLENRYHKTTSIIAVDTYYRPILSCGFFYFSNGPPLGSRAPPPLSV